MFMNQQGSGSGSGSGSLAYAGGGATDYNTGSSQLYMGDLDPNWDENVIRQIWRDLGESNVHVKMMWNSNLGVNQGYCFVEFPSMEHGNNALLKNGIVIPGFPQRRLKLNWASAGANGNNSGFSVFVGDLSPNVTEAQLFELFIGRYPSTCHAKVVHDQLTGVSKCYGFVKFNSATDQQRVLVEMQGVFLNGRSIKVGLTGGAHNDNSNTNSMAGGRSRFGGMPPNSASTVSSGNSNNRNMTPLLNSSQFMYPVQQQPTLNHLTDPNNTTVFIGGLSSLVSEDDLRQYFQPFGDIIYVKIPTGKGCGFVQYVDRLSAELAISKMQGFPLANSRIRLSWGRSSKQHNNSNNNNGQYLQQPNMQQPTYGYIPNGSIPFSNEPVYLPRTDNSVLGYQNGNAAYVANGSSGAGYDQSTVFDRLERGSNGSMFT